MYQAVYHDDISKELHDLLGKKQGKEPGTLILNEESTKKCINAAGYFPLSAAGPKPLFTNVIFDSDMDADHVIHRLKELTVEKVRAGHHETPTHSIKDVGELCSTKLIMEFSDANVAKQVIGERGTVYDTTTSSTTRVFVSSDINDWLNLPTILLRSDSMFEEDGGMVMTFVQHAVCIGPFYYYDRPTFPFLFCNVLISAATVTLEEEDRGATVTVEFSSLHVKGLGRMSLPFSDIPLHPVVSRWEPNEKATIAQFTTGPEFLYMLENLHVTSPPHSSDSDAEETKEEQEAVPSPTAKQEDKKKEVQDEEDEEEEELPRKKARFGCVIA